MKYTVPCTSSQERKSNMTLSKVGVPCLGSKEAITVTVPKSMMRLENPVCANINQTMKEKIAKLEPTIVHCVLTINPTKTKGNSHHLNK
ncbi:hypothetical protein BC830DRAFT_71594 [Chytriomyces sp. MP71]|nr:hypothetical protein BC830DRAFT_71594 [Chytriomyces sp. MP71]